MKKFIPAGIALAMILLAGCATTTAEPHDEKPTPSASSSTPSTSAIPTETPTTQTPTPTTVPTTVSPAPAPTTPAQSKKQKTIALTFDDGPGSDTDKILKILNEENVPATFFVIGNQVKGNESIIQRLSDSGMKVESHTWDHANLVNLDSGTAVKNNNRAEKAIEDVTGKPVTCIRPPYGSVNKRIRTTMEQENNKIVLWDIDPRDWAKPGSKSIVNNVKEYHHDKGVILLHDGGGDREETIAAFPQIIQYLKSKDYKFVYAC